MCSSADNAPLSSPCWPARAVWSGLESCSHFQTGHWPQRCHWALGHRPGWLWWNSQGFPAAMEKKRKWWGLGVEQHQEEATTAQIKQRKLHEWVWAATHDCLTLCQFSCEWLIFLTDSGCRLLIRLKRKESTTWIRRKTPEDISLICRAMFLCDTYLQRMTPSFKPFVKFSPMGICVLSSIQNRRSSSFCVSYFWAIWEKKHHVKPAAVKETVGLI